MAAARLDSTAVDAPFLTRLIAALVCLAASAASAESLLGGRVLDATGAPIPGAMVSVSRGDPAHAATVFTSDDGSFAAPVPDDPGADVAARAAHRLPRPARRGARRRVAAGAAPRAREPIPRRSPRSFRRIAGSRWCWRAIDDPAQREELVRQCTYCHQQGSEATRRVRSDEEWAKVLGADGAHGRHRVERAARAAAGALQRRLRPGDRGGGAHRARCAKPIRAAAVARGAPRAHRRVGARRTRLDAARHDRAPRRPHLLGRHDPGPALPARPERARRRARELVDPARRSAARRRLGRHRGQQPPGSNAHVGPHSIQVAPDGALWITLALGNQLARFDPATEQWTIHTLEDGLLPAHAALRRARPHLVHDRRVEPPRHVRSGDRHDPRDPAARAGTSGRRWCCARCRCCSGSVATSTSAAPQPRAATR